MGRPQIFNRPVLVLNALWTAHEITTLRRAFTKIYNEKARVVVPEMQFQTFSWKDWSELQPKDGETCVHAGRGLYFKIPEVVLLTKYDKMRSFRRAFSRKELYSRDNYQCQYCGVRPGSPELTIDHVLPRSRGGLTTWENCALACVECNSKKADRTPQEAGMKLRRELFKPSFSLLRRGPRKIPKSWTHFISDVYWNVEMLNDNQEEE